MALFVFVSSVSQIVESAIFEIDLYYPKFK
jgi:hypothetical protein